MRPKVVIPGIVAALLAFAVLVIGTADTTQAGTFNPELKVTVANPEPETPSDFSVEFNLPAEDVNFAAVISFIPKDWGIVPGDQIEIGTQIGTLTSEATLGLANGLCNNGLPVEFAMLNGSLDTTDTVAYLDEDGNGTGDVFEDKDGNTLADGVEKYPAFLNRLFPDLQPLRRSVGIVNVAGTPVLLQFLVFEPGTVINPALPSDPELGYPSVTVLQNIGDPEAEPTPSIITDFCAPLKSLNTFFGTTEDGQELIVNPQDGEYTFTTIALGLPDADNDGFENALDTCPYDPNVGNPKIGGGDDDSDGLDAACDPDDSVTNSDEDNDLYTNRQDNCPLVPNGPNEDNQADRDKDQIGDACDENPDTPDGEFLFAQREVTVTIGTGTGPGGPPEGFPKSLGEAPPAGEEEETPAVAETPVEQPTGEAERPPAEEEEDGGLGTGAIVGIIVGVVAAVVVVGGGLAVLARRGQS